ncbi:variable large family protein (plasmid) [Borreliella americana]
MKKISSAILLSAFIAFINCKSNVGQTAGEDNKDSESIFYQSLINLGNGFIDVFNAFGGLVADKFFKTDPKKSDVKIYFESITKTLKDTKDNLEKLSSEKEGNDSGTTNSEIDETVKKVNGWLEKMLKAAGDVAKAAAAVGDGKIGESVANGVKADAASVKGIAIGIKGIVDAASEGGVKLETAAVDDVSNKDAGKMFGTAAGGVGDAAAGEVAKAAAGW